MCFSSSSRPMNVVSVHIYHDRKGAYSGGAKTISAEVAVANLHATRAGKPLFLGEFDQSEFKNQESPPKRLH